MNTKSFKDFLSTSGPDRPKTPARSRAQRRAEVAPQIMSEVLEQRRLFAVTAGMVGGVLVVTGSSGADSIDIWSDGTDIVVDEGGGSGGPEFPIANITGIDVYGRAGDDTLNLWGAGGGGFSPPLGGRVFGEDGDDSIEGTAFGDTIYGGIGYDTVVGYGGNDTIYGGTGSGPDSDSVTGYDSLIGDGLYASGNDVIYGEGGGDTIDGGDGADYLSGGDWHDLIIGGLGADSMFGNEGDDSINALEAGGGASDILDGGNGNDCGWWVENVDDDSNMEGNFN